MSVLGLEKDGGSWHRAGLQNGVVAVDCKAIDAEAMAAIGGFGVFEN